MCLSRNEHGYSWPVFGTLMFFKLFFKLRKRSFFVHHVRSDWILFCSYHLEIPYMKCFCFHFDVDRISRFIFSVFNFGGMQIYFSSYRTFHRNTERADIFSQHRDCFCQWKHYNKVTSSWTVLTEFGLRRNAWIFSRCLGIEGGQAVRWNIAIVMLVEWKNSIPHVVFYLISENS